MSDLGLGIEYSDVLEAIKAVTNLEDSYARMVQQIIAENNRLKVLEKNADLRVEAEARALQKIEQEAQKHYDKLIGERFAFQRAMEAQQTREFAQARRQAEEENRIFDQQVRDAERAKDAYLNLAGRYDPLVRGVNEFARAQDTLQEALRRDIITLDQYWQKLDMVSEATLQGAGDFTQFGVKALMSGKNLGYHGQVMQQFGYQMQDFIVQVQSGTSAWTAFGQQGAQMAGLFGPLGANIGIIIALSAVIGGTLVRSLTGFNKSLKETAKTAKEAFDSIKQSSDLLGQAVSQDLADAFKVAKKDLQGFLDVWNQIEQKTLEKTLAGVRAGLKSSVAGTDQSIFDTNWNAQSVLEAPKELEVIFDTLRSNTLPELVSEYIEANKRIAEATALTKEQREVAQQKLMETAKELGIYDEILEKQKLVSEKKKEDNSAELAYIDALISKYATQHEKELSYLAQSRDMVAQFRSEKAAATVADAEKGLEFFRLTTEQAIKDSEAWSTEFKSLVTEAIDDADKASEALRRGIEAAQGALDSLVNTVFPENWLDTAIGKAEKLAEAFRRAINAKIEADSSNGLEFFQRTTEAAIARAEADKKSGLAFFVSTTNAAIDAGDPAKSNTGSGSGAGRGSSPVDQLAKLEKEYQQRLKMAGLMGEQLRLEEAYQEITQTLGDDIGKYSEEFLRAKAAELAATQELIDLEVSRKEIYDTVESAMTDMFMSMADGTKSVKEAFSDMARSIISELYKVLVVKQAVNAIMGFVGVSGLIPGMSGGSNTVTKVNDAVISPKGQIISTSPEDFLIATKRPQDLAKAAAGKTNSVSEGGVVVNQSFNISGSDQATVQQALARAMPAIMTATKSAIVDARKRGSSELRGAFG